MVYTHRSAENPLGRRRRLYMGPHTEGPTVGPGLYNLGRYQRRWAAGGRHMRERRGFFPPVELRWVELS